MSQTFAAVAQKKKKKELAESTDMPTLKTKEEHKRSLLIALYRSSSDFKRCGTACLVCILFFAVSCKQYIRIIKQFATSQVSSRAFENSFLSSPAVPSVFLLYGLHFSLSLSSKLKPLRKGSAARQHKTQHLPSRSLKAKCYEIC